MDISNFTKAKVLSALYNGSKIQGLGILQAKDGQMTEQDAQIIIDQRGEDLYFDYLHGKVMKIDLSSNEIRTALYNRDNGPNAAENILNQLYYN